MIYVLDTNAVSALMKGSAALVERLASHAPGDVAIPHPVIAEIAFGIERLPRSKRRKALQSRFDPICAEIPRTEWTDAVSQAYGRIKAALERRGKRIEDFDAAIAAHARASGATLVTAHLDHMARVPATRLEEQVVHHPFVLQRESREDVREGEDDMGVPDRQQLAFMLGEPLIARVRRTASSRPSAAGGPTAPLRCVSRSPHPLPAR